MAPSDRATKTIRQTVFRYSNYDTPLWSRSNTRAGRWHVPGDGPTQYFSLSTDGSWAELIRAEELQTEEAAAQVRMPLWQLRIDQARVVDYSSFAEADRVGFPAEALVDDDHERCQREGRRLRDLGYPGVLAPSAALPGELNLTVFGPRVSISWQATPRLTTAIPAGTITTGAPPPGLVDWVRFIGQRHAAYEAYRRGRSRH